MKLKNLSLVAILGALLFTSACQQDMNSTPEADLSTELDSVSYALGYQNGNFLSREGITNLNMNNFSAGMSDGLSEEEGLLTQDQMMAVTNSYIQGIAEREGAENAEEGRAFLEENKDKEGVMVTDSGLQYKVLEEGDGASPTAEDEVRVHYTGQLIDGTVFDTSVKEIAEENELYNPQREPYEGAQFPLNRVIPGWTEGVQLMQEGAKYEFYIPSELAYGSRGSDGSPIGPNATLIFEVELLEVNPSE
jgi:FKBP-type peptidyl-prolyl cis-trans isomerase